MPPCASIHSSQCAPSPCSWPCAPSCTDAAGVGNPLGRASTPRCGGSRPRRPSPAGAPAPTSIVARRERQQPLVLPHVVVLVPVVLARQAAVADDQRRRVADPAPGEQRDDVVVERRRRQVVLDAGVAVLDHRLVVIEQRAALGHDHHPQLARRLEDHLPRVAPLLVVALHAEGAGRLHPPHVHQRVVVGVDHRLERRLGAVEDRAGREEPRPELRARRGSSRCW